MKFAVVDSPCTGFEALVLSTGVEGAHHQMEEVAEILEARGVKGQVVFDLLTCNASRGRRFFAIDFDGKGFGPMRFSLVHEPSQLLNEAAAKFFKDNYAELDLGVLPAPLRIHIRNGTPI